MVVLDCRPSPSAGRCRQREQRMQTKGVREASERRWHASCSVQTDGVLAGRGGALAVPWRGGNTAEGGREGAAGWGPCEAHCGRCSAEARALAVNTVAARV